MLFTKSALVLFSSSSLLVSAWQIHSTSDTNPREYRASGSGTSSCLNRNHKRDDPLRFDRENSNCCLRVYKEVDCNVGQDGENRRSICRDFRQDIDFHFRSFFVDCDGRGINNPTLPSNGNYQPQYDNNQPYNNQPYNNQPYNNQPYNNQPYNNQPYNNQPYNNQPYNNQPYNNQPYNNQPYNNQPQYNSGPCRPGDRCYVKAEEATASNNAEAAKESETT